MDLNGPTILIAFLSGILPAVFWLWFWLKEDRHPEPKGLIILSFVLGMFAVPAVIPFEKLAFGLITNSLVLMIVWAFIEELFKYLVAYISVLRRKEDDEPIDPVIYMITVALGFSALENTFFLFNPLINEGFVGALLTGNMRFIGATVLHTVSSAMIGLFMGLSFYRNKKVKKSYFYFGFFLAVLLHTLFNFFIINGKGEALISVFVGVWVLAIILLVMFEVIKKIRKPNY
ncbi:MAG: PrsW family intramembrane metalloprotease [Patescibacteria group bacterium]